MSLFELMAMSCLVGDGQEMSQLILSLSIIASYRLYTLRLFYPSLTSYKKASPSLSRRYRQLNLLRKPHQQSIDQRGPECLDVCDSPCPPKKQVQPEKHGKWCCVEPEEPVFHQRSAASPVNGASSASSTSRTMSVLAAAGTARASTASKSATSVFLSVSSIHT